MKNSLSRGQNFFKSLKKTSMITKEVVSSILYALGNPKAAIEELEEKTLEEIRDELKKSFPIETEYEVSDCGQVIGIR